MRLLRLASLAAILLASVTTTGWAQHPADVAWTSGDIDTARQLYAERLATDSTDALALHRMALMVAWDGDYAASLALFDRILALNPQHIEAQIDRARVLAWAGRLRESVASYEAMLRRSPGNRSVRLGLAQTTAWLDDLDSARAIYADLIASNAADIEALQGIARITAWQGDLLGAEERWRAVDAMAEGDPTTLIGLSQTLRWQGRPAAALETLQRIPPDRRGTRDYGEERRSIAAAIGPWVRPAFTYEADSDEQRIATVVLRGTYPVVPRFQMGFDSYYRHAAWNEPTVDRQAWGLVATGRYLAEPGWTVGLGVGASGSNGAAAVTEPAVHASIASPARNPIGGSLTFSHSAFDATALMIDSGVTYTQGAASLRAEPWRLWQLEGGFSYADFRGSEANRRLAGYVAGTRRLTPSWIAAARVRAFGFEKNLQDGYFDPNSYLHAEAIARWRPLRGPWHVTGEAAPGLEQITSTWDPHATIRLSLQTAYDLSPGRQVGISALYSNAGLQSFSTGGAGYRYVAVTVSGSWAF
jgi:Flp pilus assembly protein TadD